MGLNAGRRAGMSQGLLCEKAQDSKLNSRPRVTEYVLGCARDSCLGFASFFGDRVRLAPKSD